MFIKCRLGILFAAESIFSIYVCDSTARRLLSITEPLKFLFIVHSMGQCAAFSVYSVLKKNR